MNKFIKSLLIVILVSGITYAAVNLNLDSGAPVTKEVWDEVMNKITELENANTALQEQVNDLEIAGGSGIVDRIGTYDTSGNITLENLVVGKPVFLTVSDLQGGHVSVTIAVISGSKDAQTSPKFVLRSQNSTYRSGWSGVIIPEEPTVVLDISIGTANDELRVYQ